MNAARTTLWGLAVPSDLVSTLDTPADSTTARTAPPPPLLWRRRGWVRVEVDVKRLLQAVASTAGTDVADAADLDGLSDETVSGTITIEDGHYRRLELPLSELVDLVEDPAVETPDLGDSALVVELDDRVEQVEAPTRVTELDLLELLGSASGPQTAFEGSGADAALLACFEQAATTEQLAACGEPA